MRSAMLAGAVLAGLCGPAGAFTWSPDSFATVYNAASAARGFAERLQLRQCDDGSADCTYTFGPGTRVVVSAGSGGRARAVTFAFDWHARSLPGLRTAPLVMMDVLGLLPVNRLRLARQVFTGDIVAYSRGPAPVTIDGISYRATDPSPADEVTYLFEDLR